MSTRCPRSVSWPSSTATKVSTPPTSGGSVPASSSIWRRRRNAGALRHRGCRQGPAVGAGAEPLDRPARGAGRHRRAGAAEVGSLRAGHRTGHRGGADAFVAWQASRCVARWDGPQKVDKGYAAGGRWPVGGPPVSTRAHPAGHRRGVDGRVGASGYVTRSATGAWCWHCTSRPPSGSPNVPVAQADSLTVDRRPEGGIADDEIAALSAAGATPVRLGPTVLRTSTAAAVALGALGVLTPRSRWSCPGDRVGGGPARSDKVVRDLWVGALKDVPANHLLRLIVGPCRAPAVNWAFWHHRQEPRKQAENPT